MEDPTGPPKDVRAVTIESEPPPGSEIDVREVLLGSELNEPQIDEPLLGVNTEIIDDPAATATFGGIEKPLIKAIGALISSSDSFFELPSATRDVREVVRVPALWFPQIEATRPSTVEIVLARGRLALGACRDIVSGNKEGRGI